MYKGYFQKYTLTRLKIPLMSLTDTTIRNAKPSEKPQKLFDGNGLYLYVSPSGGKLWRLKYRIADKEKVLSLGKYPAVSLKQARARMNEAKEKLANGIDPSEEKKRIKEKSKQEAEIAAKTFRIVALEWLETQKDTWASTNLKKKTRLLEALFNQIGEKPISEIVPSDILAVLRSYEACGKIVTAHALAQTANQVGRYARACGYCVFNAGDGLTGVLKPIQSRHYPCLTDPQEVGKLLQDIENYSGDISVMYALRILPYLALRSTELRGARWEEIDLDNALWIIPASRAERPQDGGGMKCRIEHRIPLPTQAVNLFQELRDFNQPGLLCFPGRQSASRCISDMTLLSALRRLGYAKDKMCVHGFRGTFSTLLNEKKLDWGFDADIIEKSLAHAGKDTIRASYNHADYFEQRKSLMQKWADYLDELRKQVR